MWWEDRERENIEGMKKEGEEGNGMEGWHLEKVDIW